ncbi:MAG: YvcK family protein [Caldilineaceae bacterium]|nr:YvcK family protein [Caldilineaceae bacterium]
MANRFWRRSARPQSLWSHALLPGIRIKRWIVLLLAGVTITGLGLAFMILETYRGRRLPPIIYDVSLDFLPDWLRGALFITVGFLVIGLAVWQLNRTILLALLPGQAAPRNLDMVSEVLRRQRRRQGPSIVVVGGGTGMPQLLRGLRAYTDNITAIVTVADDGGSSGRLRQQMGMLPPGDFRNNIAALSEAEELMTRVFQYRFAEREVRVNRAGHGPHPATEKGDADHTGSELAGHSFGNLFITTMTAVTGSFESGLAEISRVLAVRGRVLPSTLEQVTLCAELRRVHEDGREQWLVVEGESKITSTEGQVMRVFLKPETPRAYPQVIQAILQADLIVAGLAASSPVCCPTCWSRLSAMRSARPMRRASIFATLHPGRRNRQLLGQ